jgi:hypothetical protein
MFRGLAEPGLVTPESNTDALAVEETSLRANDIRVWELSIEYEGAFENEDVKNFATEVRW